MYYIVDEFFYIDGHAFTYYNGNGKKLKQYIFYINGKKHRENEPAIIEYYANGKEKRVEYWINGGKHRENEPAVKLYYDNGKEKRVEYWINSRRNKKMDFPVINFNKKGEMI